MIKTININLSGIVFHINEDAYGKLNTYLTSVRNKFKGTEGGEEIISDIESRIAEIFTERLDNSRQVIEHSDVDFVIATMGSPEEYELDEDQDSYYEDDHSFKKRKRLYRDPDDKIIGGVASGIAAFINIDPVIIRILWVILALSGGTGIPIYIILWIVIPEAKTTAEKLEMKGDKVNIENIEKKIREEFEYVKESFSNMGEHARKAGNSKTGKRARNIVSDFFEILITVISRLLKFAFKFIGIILIVVGILTIPALFFSYHYANLAFSDLYFSGSLIDIMNSVFSTTTQVSAVIILSIIALSIPLILLLLLGIRILTGKSVLNTVVVILFAIIWIVSLTALGGIGFNTAMDYNARSSITEQNKLNIPGDTIYIKTNKVYNDDDYFLIEEDLSISMRDGDQGKELLFSDFELDIRKSRTSQSELRIIKYARGKNSVQAKERLKNIDFSFNTQGNSLILDNYFSTPAENKIREQKIKLVLMIPEGTVVYLDDNLLEFIDHVENVNDLWGYQMLGHYWLMTEEGLECTDCDGMGYNFHQKDFKLKKKSVIHGIRYNISTIIDHPAIT